MKQWPLTELITATGSDKTGNSDEIVASNSTDNSRQFWIFREKFENNHLPQVGNSDLRMNLDARNSSDDR
jgi:hypothetical protein